MGDNKRVAAAAAELAAALQDRAVEIGEDARSSAEAAYKTVKHEAEDGIDTAHRYLRRQWKERPIAVAASAAGIGLLLGMLLSGGRRH